MYIDKVNIYNYKCYEGKFTIEFNNEVNILVGDNEAGKSTILEAINLALSGILHGRYIKNELSQYLFNNNVVKEYITQLKKGNNPHLPEIAIEVFFNKDSHPSFKGNFNKDISDACGLTYKIEFDDTYKSEYKEMVDSDEVITTIPIEYYKITWKSFDRDAITSRSIPIKSVLIDSTSNKYQNGSDVYISRIIRNDLEDIEKVNLSQAYRKMKDSFMDHESVRAINQKIDKKANLTNKDLKVSVDLSTQNSWETTLMTYLDDVPFHQVGKGEQCIIKTNLALAHNKTKEASLILLEEPENHLSHTKLNTLIKEVTDNCKDKQIVISTHSSFVANKLGLENLILLNDRKTTRISEQTKETYSFFKKLPGYQTLRLLLCKKAVLVEGDSDELIFQRAYMDANNGRLPIEDGIDVISVKLTFLRFIEIADKIDKRVAVITDNDRDYDNKISKKYIDYKDHAFIRIFADNRNKLNTLEPQFVDANKKKLATLCKIIGIDSNVYKNESDISEYMEKKKTEWALKVFESKAEMSYPKYIVDAVEWCCEK
ncbi:ATP-dependent nuclease [Vibrio atlanticus]|uniref:ATP-dependent nuclease n=1 Tax=Vibrio atlanticus TaxID=693153 RepID=UPI003554345F